MKIFLKIDPLSWIFGSALLIIAAVTKVFWHLDYMAAFLAVSAVCGVALASLVGRR